MEAKGNNGILFADDFKITIKREGLNARLLNLRGQKEIYIKDISSIQFKKPGMISNGFIQFSFAGSNEKSGGTFNAATDENSVVFTAKQLQNFEKIKDFIDRRRNELLNQVSNPLNASKHEKDIYAEIEKLADLRNKGIVTIEEFEMKKRQLLGL